MKSPHSIFRVSPPPDVLRRLEKLVAERWESDALPGLLEFVTIPNTSPLFGTDPRSEDAARRAARAVSGWIGDHAPDGSTVEILEEPNRSPLVLAEIPGDAEGTVLVYGHYVGKEPRSGLLLGFGASDETSLDSAVQRLGKVLEECTARGRDEESRERTEERR